ncbi:hypothetical protein PCIT_a3968 [Pseudoalteromonas citrea]|uniref:Uncharacterized protein n=2 Tax=Pseudoalteromonas citrea TaxID=43655 RepID=A0AAD4AIJ1_9GAMM|nr:hypothetical protein [Pseudoalteromonas citrea]KAF7771399.1 hypothetical protein PCIT_a3968 [Pseudoalteromonas citrea]
MKKSILALLGATVLNDTALANSVFCYVDTRAYDNYSQGECFGGDSLDYVRDGGPLSDKAEQ